MGLSKTKRQTKQETDSEKTKDAPWLGCEQKARRKVHKPGKRYGEVVTDRNRQSKATNCTNGTWVRRKKKVAWAGGAKKSRFRYGKNLGQWRSAARGLENTRKKNT